MELEPIFHLDKFDYEKLVQVFSNGFYPHEKIRKNPITLYLHQLFSSKVFDEYSCSFIISENYYLSNSYLDDFGSYYTKSFRNYNKFSKRVHFFKAFNKEFNSTADFQNYLLADSFSPDEIIKNYLGYVVIKPISNSFIGATLLVPPHKSISPKHKINIKSVVHENVNFFGHEIPVLSLGFQQQDEVVSACATNALWSAFHYSWGHFRTPMQSPNAITKSAGMSMLGGRIFPASDGLDNRQICKSIENIGLHSELRVYNQPVDKKIGINNFLKRFIYAYNKMGLPVLFGFTVLPERSNHLVTLIGFETLLESVNQVKDDNNIKLDADSITKFLVHDDQLGPFYLIEPDIQHDSIKNEVSDVLICKKYKLNRNSTIKEDEFVSKISSIIIPVDPVIRVKFENIYQAVNEINLLLSQVETHPETKDYSLKADDFSWSIFLDKSNSYKEDVKKDIAIKEYAVYIKDHMGENEIATYDYIKTIKSFINLSSFPKYVWVARLFYKNRPVIDFIFDATDTPSGFNLYQINYFDPSVKQIFINLHRIIFRKDATGLNVLDHIYDSTEHPELLPVPNLVNTESYLNFIMRTESTENCSPEKFFHQYSNHYYKK